MKINGHGQAKILPFAERQLLIEKGFLCQRDRTLFHSCFYLACRISEARQLKYDDVFHQGEVREEIVLQKSITKGKRKSRTIPVNDKLASALKLYVEESQELLAIYLKVGNWDHKSIQCSTVIGSDGRVHCPKCGHISIKPAGTSRGKQLYKCTNCGYRFQEKTVFAQEPLLKERIIELGVFNSYSYGFLFLNPSNPYLFPGANARGCLSRSTCKGIFSKALDRVEIKGASSHSCRRTALTEMNRAGVPLKVIQSISGHSSLRSLQYYLEVEPEEVKQAIMQLPSV